MIPYLPVSSLAVFYLAGKLSALTGLAEEEGAVGEDLSGPALLQRATVVQPARGDGREADREARQLKARPEGHPPRLSEGHYLSAA